MLCVRLRLLSFTYNVYKMKNELSHYLHGFTNKFLARRLVYTLPWPGQQNLIYITKSIYNVTYFKCFKINSLKCLFYKWTILLVIFSERYTRTYTGYTYLMKYFTCRCEFTLQACGNWRALNLVQRKYHSYSIKFNT